MNFLILIAKFHEAGFLISKFQKPQNPIPEVARIVQISNLAFPDFEFSKTNFEIKKLIKF